MDKETLISKIINANPQYGAVIEELRSKDIDYLWKILLELKS